MAKSKNSMGQSDVRSSTQDSAGDVGAQTRFREGLRRLRDGYPGGIKTLAQRLGRSTALVYSWSRQKSANKPSIRELAQLALLDATLTGRSVEQSVEWWRDAAGYDDIPAPHILSELNEQSGADTGLLRQVIEDVGKIVEISGHIPTRMLSWAVTARMSQHAAEQDRKAWFSEDRGGRVMFLFEFVPEVTETRLTDRASVAEICKMLAPPNGATGVDEDSRHERSLYCFLLSRRSCIDDARQVAGRSVQLFRNALGERGDRYRAFCAERPENWPDEYLGDVWVYQTAGKAMAHFAMPIPDLEQRLRQAGSERPDLGETDIIARPWYWAYASVQISDEQLGSFLGSRGFVRSRVLNMWEPITSGTDTPALRWTEVAGVG